MAFVNFKNNQSISSIIKLTTTKPMIIHLPTIAFDVIILRFPFCDLKGFPGNDDVGGTGPAGPFLAVGAVASVSGVGG